MTDKRARVEIFPGLFRVNIRGFRASDEEQKHHRRPLLPNDHGLVDDFRKWMLANNIHPAFPSTQGGGVYVGYFKEESQERITAWLRAHNLIE